MIKTDEGDRKVILVKLDYKLKKPLITYFGRISLKWKNGLTLVKN